MLAGKLQFESLYNGAVDLAAVALLNDALDVLEENQRRAQEAAERR